MAEMLVAKVSEFEDPGRKVFDLGGMEVGVFKLGGEFYAWENRCPHYDGPACQGRIVAELMRGAMELSVPLKVDVGLGESWLEAK